LTTSAAGRPLLEVRGLDVRFQTRQGQVHAVDDVSFDLFADETVALVGETGCGKSVVASSIMRLLPPNSKADGEVLFQGRDLLSLTEKEMASLRGSEVAIIFQNPSLALNPIMRVIDQVAEPLQVHRKTSRQQSKRLAKGMLERLGLGGERMKRMWMYPFQFSGGMNQRVMISISLALSPKIIIADEPTRGLDASWASRGVGEMERIREQYGASLLLITHDLALAEGAADRMAVMYCGEILEMGGCSDILEDPAHPYTRALLDCRPKNGFRPIPGSSPSMIHPPEGCRFRPRCPHRSERCRQRPAMSAMSVIAGSSIEGQRQVRCWRC